MGPPADRGAWAARAGASMALATGRHDYTCARARALCAEFSDLDGIAYHAAKDGGPAIARRLAGICDELGYRLV